MNLNIVRILEVMDAVTYIVNDKREPHQDVVLYIHGGAWFQDPLDNHFDLLINLQENWMHE